MNTTWQDIRYKILHSGSKLNLLIGINVAIFLLINIPSTVEWLFFRSNTISSFTQEYLAMVAHLPTLAKHFWTPITYMFMHAGVFHILFNMLWLYWMGQLFEEYLGTKRIIGLYIAGGLAGALFYVAGYNLIPAFADSPQFQFIPVVGASASVMAIVVAVATLLPNYTIYLMLLGPVKLKWIAMFYIVLDFLSIAGPNAGGELAHLGGALLGFVYIKQLQRGNGWGDNLNSLFKPKSKIKVVSRNGVYQKSKNSNTIPQQEEIDRILDKISQSGYDSLNKQEKETLFRASNNE